MSVNLFNYTNQKLNAEKMREVSAFNSGDFGGIICANSPFSISGTTVTLTASEDAPITFMGGGVLLNQVSTEYCSLASSDKLWYLEVILDSSVANITTDKLIEHIDEETQVEKITFKSTTCDYISKSANYTYYTPIKAASGNPNANRYYEYNNGTYTISGDGEVISSKIYYAKIEANAIIFKANSLSTATFTYFGNTVWISDNTFIIPLFANISDELVQTVLVKDVSDLEGLLTLESYARLKAYCEGSFVWSSGGREPVMAPDGSIHRKGDIGNLNITEDTIYNNTNYGTDDNPDYHDPVKIQNLTINNLSNVNNSPDTKLIVDSRGHISVSQDYVQPVAHGGTGATTRAEAKANLGIYYGTSQPTPSNIYSEGDIYLWIIE